MWPQAASRLWGADKPRPQPHRLSLDKQQLAPKDRKSGFQESRPTTWCMTPAAVAYPPPYASGGPAGGQTVAFDPREQGDGLRPKPLLHSGSVGSFQGHQGPGLRPSPGRPVSSLRCGPRQPPLRPLTPFPLEKRSGSAAAARRAVLGGWHTPSHPKTGKRAVGPFLSGWRVKGATRPRLAGAARSPARARTRARRGEPLTGSSQKTENKAR